MGNDAEKDRAVDEPLTGDAHRLARAATADTRYEEIESVLRGLLVAARMLLLYPAGHNRVTKKLADLRADILALFEQRAEPLELTVAGHRLLVGDAKFDQFSEVGESFAGYLRHRQIRAIVIAPGVDLDEVRLLVDLLGIDHRALFRVGGTKAFLDARPHPHIQFLLFEGGVTPSLPASGSGTDEAPLDPLLQSIADEAAGDAGMPAGAEGDPKRRNSDQERFEQQLEEFALRDLLDGAPQKPGEETVAFAVEPGLLMDAEIQGCIADDGGEMRERMRRHSSEDTALRILFRLLAEAPDEEQYRHRRRLLLQAVRDPRFFTGELIHVIRRLLDRKDWGFERGAELAQSVIAYVNDAAAVTQLLASIPLVPEVAKGVLSCLAAREDALPLLGRLLTAQLPSTIANDLPRVFLELAEADPRRFSHWALQDRATLLRPSVLRILIENASSLLAPVCERLLLERQAHDRKKLLHLLGSNGTEVALRLLTRAVRACGPGVAPEALQALGRFPHPLALEVLREVVERNNRDEIDLEEVEAALHSIHALGIKEAHALLWEIVQSRRSLFSYAYVRPVRIIAESVLQGGRR
ncbi:MAG TPA: hypothetical protein VFY93_19155 [Planctomycetota bacterium]|nr:hypothetical protein [Planctomycetota bacterium]